MRTALCMQALFFVSAAVHPTLTPGLHVHIVGCRPQRCLRQQRQLHRSATPLQQQPFGRCSRTVRHAPPAARLAATQAQRD